MYGWVKPKISIPVHGERRHLMEHAKLAIEEGVTYAHAPSNGEMIKLSSSGPEIVDIVPSGRLHEDGHVIVKDSDNGLRLRRRMAYAGHISISLVYDNKGPSGFRAGFRGSAGFPKAKKGEHLEDLLDEVADAAEEAFAGVSKKAKSEEDNVEDRIASVVKRHINRLTGKRNNCRSYSTQDQLMLGPLNHVGVAVPDIRAAMEMYREKFEVTDITEPKALPAQGVTYSFVNLPTGQVELIEPYGDNSPITKFLEKNPQRRPASYSVLKLKTSTRPVSPWPNGVCGC